MTAFTYEPKTRSASSRVFPGDGAGFCLGDAATLWNLNESTLRKAIAYGKLVDGVDVCKFGKQWVISTEAMHREDGNARP